MATLRALECLVALVDAGSMTEAAAALHMSQPALSHQIAALERELDTAVVERLSRGVRPTAAGRAAAAQARAALEAAERAVQLGREVGEGHAGSVRVACVETMTAWLLVPVLRQWRLRRPEVALDLTEFTSADRMCEYLAAGQADLGVGPRPTDTALEIEVLGREEVVVVAAPGHRFADQDAVAVPQLAGEPFVHYDRTNGMASWVDQFVARAGVTLTPVLRTRSPRTAAQLAAAGMGVAIVPASALMPRPVGVVRPLRPEVRRDIVVVGASRDDALVQRFLADLRRRGLPGTPAGH
jgi:DNA-binding transcriptional LysR family regulator